MTRLPGPASCHQVGQSSRDIISFFLLYSIMFEGEHRHFHDFWYRCWFRFWWFWFRWFRGHGCRDCCRVFFSRKYLPNHSSYHLYHLLTGPTLQILCELWLADTCSSLDTAIESTIHFAFSIQKRFRTQGSSGRLRAFEALWHLGHFRQLPGRHLVSVG